MLAKFYSFSARYLGIGIEASSVADKCTIVIPTSVPGYYLRTFTYIHFSTYVHICIYVLRLDSQSLKYRGLSTFPEQSNSESVSGYAHVHIHTKELTEH